MQEAQSNQTISVFRNSNQSKSIPAKHLLVGDIYRLQTGMIIPADSILIQAGHNLDESISSKDTRQRNRFKTKFENGIVCSEEELTGEHEYKQKTPITCKSAEEFLRLCERYQIEPSKISNVLYAKSYIVKGQGTALVCAVGAHTQYGISLSGNLTDLDGHILTEQLELKDLLQAYSIYMAKLVNIFVVIFMSAMIGRFYLQNQGYLEEFAKKKTTSLDYFDYFLKCLIMNITLIISVIPEALTLAVIYCLSEYSSLELFSKGKLVFRKLKSLENMGRVNCLCLEKQGTLTSCGKMQVKEF